MLRAAEVGTGIIAGGPMRAVFEALGVQDVVAKSVGTSNPHNMIRATFEALGRGVSPRQVAQRRGKKVSDVLRSEEHTSELQSLMRISYAVSCLKKNNTRMYDET